jgi:hypothetical protein
MGNRKQHTSSLRQKCNHVSSHKDLGHPLLGDRGHALGIQGNDQSSEDHVYRGGEKSRTEQNEDRLDAVDGDGFCVRMGDDSSGIPNDFNFCGSACLLSCGGTRMGEGHSQTPPMTSGVKYHDLALTIWYTWYTVVAKNATKKITAAPRLGV